jgi:diacylglycerol kinase
MEGSVEPVDESELRIEWMLEAKALFIGFFLPIPRFKLKWLTILCTAPTPLK